VRVGETARREPSPVVAVTNEPLVLTTSPDLKSPAFTLQALSGDGAIGWERRIEVETSLPDERQMIWDGSRLHIFWLDRGQLFHLELDDSGEEIRNAEKLATEIPVGYFNAALRPDGALTLWYSGTRADPAVYALPPGSLHGAAAVVDPLGIRPSLQYDRQGTLHASWARYPTGLESEEFYYARLAGGVYDRSANQLLIKLQIPLNQVLTGPRLGLDLTHVYLAWSVEVRSGMSTGDLMASYMSFPISRLGVQRQVKSLRIPTPFDLPYEVVTGQGKSEVILAQADLPTTGRVTDISFLPGQPAQAMATFKAQVDYRRRKSQWQVGTLRFEEGSPSAYQLVSFTTAESAFPRLESDEEGFYYLTWLEGGSRESGPVYITSTNPGLRTALSRLTPGDVTQMAAESLFGMASGVILFWFPLIWLLGSLIVLFLTSPLRREDEPLLRPGTLISLLLGVGVFWVAKMFIFPNMFDYVPFSAWVPVIPAAWRDPLRLATPVLITLTALAIGLWFTYKRDQRSPLFFISIYGLIDGFLTLALYGVIFWGDI
jgi:hypothetical protein